jgi:hypothetical protein
MVCSASASNGTMVNSALPPFHLQLPDFLKTLSHRHLSTSPSGRLGRLGRLSEADRSPIIRLTALPPSFSCCFLRYLQGKDLPSWDPRALWGARWDAPSRFVPFSLASPPHHGSSTRSWRQISQPYSSSFFLGSSELFKPRYIYSLVTRTTIPSFPKFSSTMDLSFSFRLVRGSNKGKAEKGDSHRLKILGERSRKLMLSRRF